MRPFIIWLKLPMAKRSILIGSLSGPYFAFRAAKMDRSQTDLICVFEKMFKGNFLEISKNLSLLSDQKFSIDETSPKLAL